MKPRWPDLAVALGVLALDQASKAWASRHLSEPVTVVPGLFQLELSHNPGALFGWFGGVPDPWRTIALTGLPLIAVAAIVTLLVRTPRAEIYGRVGLALILGGAIGNLVDRIVYGQVVDFLDLYANWQPAAGLLSAFFHQNHWPTFNVADMGLVFGIVLLLFEILLRRPAIGRRDDGNTKESARASLSD